MESKRDIVREVDEAMDKGRYISLDPSAFPLNMQLFQKLRKEGLSADKAKVEIIKQLREMGHTVIVGPGYKDDPLYADLI